MENKQFPENGDKIQLIKDVAELKAEAKFINEKFDDVHKKLDENHGEMKNMFGKLQGKVNEEITTAHTSIASNRKLYIRLLIGAMVLGSFIWIKESRDFIVHNWFRF